MYRTSLELFIALRYLFARRGRSVVTVISWVSLIGLMVSTAALIVVLSVYNGIGDITRGLFGTFDPELLVEPANGKTFRTSAANYGALAADPDVEAASQLVEETAWMTYADEQAIVSLRGVDDNYRRLSGLDTLLNEGSYRLRDTACGTDWLMAGGEVWYNLGMRLHSNTPVAIHMPKRGTASMGYTFDQAFNSGYAYPAGCFFIQQDIDSRYAVTGIGLVRRLMGYADDEVTAVAVKLRPGADAAKAKGRLATTLSTPDCQLTVKDRYDQQPLYFKIFRTERLGIYLVLALIVLISTLSLVASLSLLIINKRHDVFTLRSFGMTRRRVRHIFLAEGLLICLLAVMAGLAVGFVVCFLQQQFGIVRMGDGNFVVEAFPVAMRAADFLYTFLLVMVLSSLSVLLTVRRARV